MMQTKCKRLEKVLALMLAFILVFTSMSSSIAMALDGEVTKSTEFTFMDSGYKSTNYHFELECEYGKTWYGTCMEPKNQQIPDVGDTVDMSQVSGTNMVAKIAYAGTQRIDLTVPQRRYIISRAVALHLNRIDSYSMQEDVDKLLATAKDTTVPQNFFVYKSDESDYGQQILAWRTVAPTIIKVKKSIETSDSGVTYSKKGAIYGLYETAADANSDHNRIKTLTTDANGNSNEVTLYYIGERNYFVKEVSAPPNLGLDETLYKRTKATKNALKEGQTWVIQSEEPLLEGGIKVQKVTTVDPVPEGFSLAGAVYGVYDTEADAKGDTNRRKTLTTKETGFSNKVTMDAGTYYVKEVSCPSWLELDTAVHTVTVTANKTATLLSTDPPKPGKLKVQKLINASPVPAGQTIAGAVYAVYDSWDAANIGNTAAALTTLVTDAAGTTGEATLYPGMYYVRESSCPSWLDLDQTIYPAEIIYGQTEPLVIESIDWIKPGYITLLKKVNGIQDYPITGAEYGIYTSETNANSDTGRIDTLVTESDGTTNTVQVEAGKTYYVKEIKPPAHYQSDPSLHSIFVPYGDRVTVTVTSVETPNPGWMKTHKTTKTVAPASKKDYSVEGARYGIFKSEADAKTKNESLAIDILKIQKDGYSQRSKTLQPGTYYVQETWTPANMEPDPDMPRAVRIYSDHEETVESVDPISTGTAKVKKVAASESYVLTECPQNYSLAGAEYKVYTDETAAKNQTASKCVGTLVTDKNGESNEVTLTVGDYWIVEIKASPGFKLDGQPPTKITIKRNETTTHTSKEPPLTDPITIILDKEPGNDKANKPSLSGAVFEVKYYAKVTDSVSELTGEEVLRTWYFKTKLENGVGVIGFRDDYLDPVRNKEELYKNDDGIPTGMIGSYVITEVEAPAGYIKDPTPIITTVDNTGTVTNPEVSYTNKTNINDPKEFRLKLEKLDSETGKRAQGDATLAGAVFALYRNGEEIGRYTTDKNYSFTTEYFNIGDGTDVYTVKELSPPDGYLPDSTAYRLTKLEGDTITEQFTTEELDVKNDVIKGKFAVTKTLNAQAATGALVPEPGIQFEVYLTSAGSFSKALDSEKDLITTDADGYAETKMLPYGVYTVHQVNSTEGHGKVPDFTININENNETERRTINNDEFDADLHVTKVDSETGKVIPVVGATFKLRKAGSSDWISFLIKYPNKHTVSEFVTDETGTFQLPDRIPFGDYELVETKSPYGYLFSAAPVAFKVDGSVDTVELTVENDPQKGVIEITKTGEILKSVTENADGSYTPVFGEGYIKDAVFDIFAKTDIVTPDGTKRYSAGEKVDTVTTNASGIATSKALYLGEYEVKEVTAGENHVLNTSVFNAELTYDAQKVQVSDDVAVENDRQKAAVTLVKNLETDDLYKYGKDNHKDIVFGIYADEEIPAEDGTSIPKDGMVEAIGVKEDGSAYSGSFTCDLPHGSFYVQEKETAEGYILDNTKYAVDFDYTDQTVATVNIAVNSGNAIDNDIIRGDIKGQKVSETDVNLSGAVIGLFWDGETEFTESNAILTDPSDENGAFEFKNVAYGKYIVREIKQPIGYALTKQSYSVTFDEDGEVIPVKVKNEITKFDIAKTDIVTGDYVIGAQLAIIPLDSEGNPDIGNTFETWLTEDEEHRVEGLEVGKTYILRETLTGQAWDYGYVTAEDIEFTVPDTGDVQKMEMKDDFTKVDIAKTDIVTGEPVVGAQLAIIPLNFLGLPDVGATFETWITDDKEHRVERIPVGDYILRETKTPAGYVKAEDLAFSVKDTAEVQLFTLKNDFTKVEILKADAELKKPLAGATLRLTDENGVEIATWESEENAKQFCRLPVGTYTLTELKAPDGYEKAEPMIVEVKETAELLTYIMLDEKTVVAEPDPQPELDPIPVPEPQPEPEPEPAPDSEPLPTPLPEPETEPDPETPQTGDMNHPLGWMMVAILGVSGLIAGTRRRD